MLSLNEQILWSEFRFPAILRAFLFKFETNDEIPDFDVEREQENSSNEL